MILPEAEEFPVHCTGETEQAFINDHVLNSVKHIVVSILSVSRHLYL